MRQLAVDTLLARSARSSSDGRRARHGTRHGTRRGTRHGTRPGARHGTRHWTRLGMRRGWWGAAKALSSLAPLARRVMDAGRA
eukprot:gene21216-biopygen1092